MVDFLLALVEYILGGDETIFSYNFSDVSNWI